MGMKKKMTEECLRFSCEDEDQTDEARTNEEVLEEIEKLAHMKYPPSIPTN